MHVNIVSLLTYLLTVTSPAAEHHCPLADTNYTAWWHTRMWVNNFPRVAPSTTVAGVWTRDLLIVSPAPQQLLHRATQGNATKSEKVHAIPVIYNLFIYNTVNFLCAFYFHKFREAYSWNYIPVNPASNWIVELPLQLPLTNLPVKY